MRATEATYPIREGESLEDFTRALTQAAKDHLQLAFSDALDAAEMPAVAYPTPGGLTYTHVTDLIAGVAAKARIAGFCMVEFVPGRDRSKIAAFTAARIAANVVGRIRPRAD